MSTYVRARDYFNLAESVWSPGMFLDAKDCYRDIRDAHRDQYRKEMRDGQPVRYVEHPIGAAMICLDELNITDFDLNRALLYHDAVEDTKITLVDIERACGSAVAMLVLALTKRPRYVELMLRNRDWRVSVGKGCDNLHNLRSIGPETDLDFIKKQIHKTSVTYRPVFDRMVEIAPSEYIADVASLHKMIFNRVENLRLLVSDLEAAMRAEPDAGDIPF